jgi:hypothetical protein
VLALLMREAAAWLGDPDSALTAAAPALYQERVEQLVLEQDPVRTWVAEECEAYQAGERSRALYEAFVGWTKNGNTHPGRIPSETKWGKELSALGYPIEKRRDGNYRPLRLKPRTPWAGPTVIISAQPPAPVSDAGIGGGLVEACGGLVSQPSTHHDPMNSGPISPSNDLVEGVGGRITSMTRMRAHDAHAHETQPVNAPHPPQPSTPLAADPEADSDLPESAKITAKLLAAKAAAQAEAPAAPFDESDRPEPHHQPVGEQGPELRTTTPPASRSAAPARGPSPRRSRQPRRSAPRYDPAERAAAKEAAKQAELAARIAEASGELVDLPALVTRDGAVRSIALGDVPAIVAGFSLLDELTVDVEHTGYPIGHADYALRTIQLGNENVALVFDADDGEQCRTAARCSPPGACCTHTRQPPTWCRWPSPA